MIPLIHDCDPGNDDALGILVAAGHSGLELLAVTTLAGHLDAPRTARNAAIAAAMAAPVRVPVAAGASRPLIRDRLVAAVLDPGRGLDRERPDLPAVALDPRHAVGVIGEVAAERPGLTVAATGPLTNLALALRLDPMLAGRIGRIVSLGGAWGLGNKTAAAEWNVLSDPEAAAVVYGAGIPVTMVPIDAAAAVGIDAAFLAEVDGIGGPVAAFAAELLASLGSTYRPPLFGPAAAPLNDPLALLVAAEPGLARTVPARVDIELGPGVSYGRTVIDFAGRSGRPANAEVVVGFDVKAVKAAFVAAVARLAALSPLRLLKETI